MSGPTKRQDRPGKLVPLGSTSAAAPLTHDEQQMLELFRATTDKQLLLGFAAVCVKTTPCHKRPVLRLVRGGVA